MKIFVWTKCNVNYLNLSFWHFWPQYSIFILQLCVLFGDNNERNIQEGPSPGKILKKPQFTHKEPHFHSSLCLMPLGGLCPCTFGNPAGCGAERARTGRSHQQPRWSLGLFGVMAGFCHVQLCTCCPWFGREWTHWETSCPYLCVYHSSLWDFWLLNLFSYSQTFKCPWVWKYTIYSLFTHSYTNLGPSFFFWWQLFITEMYPRVRSSFLCFRNQFYFISSVLPEPWIEISGARLDAMSHIGVLAAPQASTSPNKICQADKKLISLLHSFSRHSSSPGCGRNAELGLELVSAQVRSELAVWNVAVDLLCLGHLFAAICIQFSALGALWGAISPCVYRLIQRCLN